MRYVNQTQLKLSHNRDVDEAAVRACVYEGVTRDAAGPSAAAYRNPDAGTLSDEFGERVAAVKLSRQ